MECETNTKEQKQSEFFVCGYRPGPSRAAIIVLLSPKIKS